MGMTLHEAIESVLREAGRPMTTGEIAVAVNAAGIYAQKDGSPVTDFQVHGRTKNYSEIFSREGRSVSLRAD